MKLGNSDGLMMIRAGRIHRLKFPGFAARVISGVWSVLVFNKSYGQREVVT
jgi:hypothetical protein